MNKTSLLTLSRLSYGGKNCCYMINAIIILILFLSKPAPSAFFSRPDGSFNPFMLGLSVFLHSSFYPYFHCPRTSLLNYSNSFLIGLVVLVLHHLIQRPISNPMFTLKCIVNWEDPVIGYFPSIT